VTEAMTDEELDQAGLSLEAQQEIQQQQMMQGMPPEQGAAPPVSQEGAMQPLNQIPTPGMNLETEIPA